MLPLGLTFNAGDLDYVAKLQSLSSGIDEIYNAYIASLGGGSFQDTSTSSVAIGTGAKTFTVTAGKSFVRGMLLTIARTADPAATYMIGTVTSYSGTTLNVTVPAASAFGSGTYTDWEISLTGSRGVSGIPAVSANGTNFTASANTRHIITAGSITATLPASPTDGDTIYFTTGAALATAWTVARNGNTIMGLSEDMTVNSGHAAFVLVYRAATTDWRLAQV